MVIEGLRTRVA